MYPSIQNFGGENDLLIRVERKVEAGISEEAAQEKAINAIKSVVGESNDYRRIETVGPKVGSELIANSLKAVSFALIAMLIYLFRGRFCVWILFM